MKTHRLVWLAMPFLGMSAFAADISGTWELRFKADWTRVPDLICSLAQRGDVLTGQCRAAADPDGPKVDLSSGTVEGDTVSCRWSVVTPNGETWTYQLSGTVDGKAARITGAFTLSGPFGTGEGTFAAERREGRAARRSDALK
jgi:hypothetical protein